MTGSEKQPLLLGTQYNSSLALTPTKLQIDEVKKMDFGIVAESTPLSTDPVCKTAFKSVD